MIEIKNLTHDYKDFRALHNINIQFKENEITALVGPNGAGKTTLLSNICGLLPPTKGQVFIDGEDVYNNPRKAHEKIGYLPDFFGLYNNLTVKQHLIYSLESHAVDAALHENALNETLELIGLTDKVNERAADLSRGMRQRLAIGQVIIYKPKYIILDEPASGLDPEARLKLSQLLIHLKNSGKTLVVSSHILAELEEYATELVVLREGKVFSDKIMDNPERVIPQSQSIYIKSLRNFEEVAAIIKQFDENLQPIQQEDAIQLNFVGDKEMRAKLLGFLSKQEAGIYHFETKEKRMQDIYFESIK